MNAADRHRAVEFDERLRDFDTKRRRLPPLDDQPTRACFIGQLIESVRRVRYVAVMREQELSPLRADPSSSLFDPIKAAVIHLHAGNIDEAGWLIFLSVHFGRSSSTGWALAREVYLGSGSRGAWTWARTSKDPAGFRKWLQKNLARLKGTKYRFGNHRKYQSLDGEKDVGTGAAIESYIKWIGPNRGHQAMFDSALSQTASDGGNAFDELYRSMEAVSSFGRMARFDYLTMIGKVGLAGLEPLSTYMDGATGPYKGARLLFGIKPAQKISRSDLDKCLIALATHLDVGMQIIEDAVCNWQKSPKRLIRFRG